MIVFEKIEFTGFSFQRKCHFLFNVKSRLFFSFFVIFEMKIRDMKFNFSIFLRLRKNRVNFEKFDCCYSFNIIKIEKISKFSNVIFF